MKYRPLGRTGLDVSLIGLGTMTWGQQNTESEAHAQLDAAVAAGINLVDTAEMYPVPPKPETQGRTESYIGTWLKARGSRDRIVLATKAAGPSRNPGRPNHIRGGDTSFTKRNLEAALNDSLKRLQTDHVDLYQLHWPDRTTNVFGQRGYVHAADEDTVPIEETLDALQSLVQAGKVRFIGVSNETPWGLSRFLHLAETRGLPRVASIQNPYNLVNRSYELGLSEISHREDVGLLVYSALAMGTLTGKYLAGQRPAGSRLTLFDRFGRYKGETVERATYDYVSLFRRHGLDPAQAALAFVNSRPFVASTLIGATSLAQLEANIASVDLQLPDDVIAGIEALQDRYPNPAA